MTTFVRFTIFMAAAIALMPSAPAKSAGDVPQTMSTAGLRQKFEPANMPSQASASSDQDPDAAQNPQTAASITGNLSQPITADMKVQIIRYIDGEFGKAAKSLPGKTNGFTIVVGKPISDQAYQDALRLQGTAIGAGDPIQVTRVDFGPKKIILQLNGGAKKKFHLMDHLQIGLGGDPDPGDVAPPPDTAARRGEGVGAVIVLDYEKPLPDVSPNDIKEELSPFIDFSKSHSAAVNWIDTLSPAFQAAIRDHKALPGMDQQTVIAAIGRPDKKVRQTNPDGIEAEDWIYGNPPAKTLFVTFIGEKVSKVEECGGPQTDAGAAPTCSVN
jgi:hypothetical protein